MIKLQMLPLLQSGLNDPFTNVTEKAKYYMTTPYMLSLIQIVLIFLTKVTNEEKSFMNTPHMLSMRRL